MTRYVLETIILNDLYHFWAIARWMAKHRRSWVWHISFPSVCKKHSSGNSVFRMAYLTVAMLQKSTTQVSRMAYLFVSESQNG